MAESSLPDAGWKSDACAEGRGALRSLLSDTARALTPANHMPITRRDVLATVLLSLILFAATIPMLWGEWAVDFSAYYFAGHFYHLGEFAQIYNGPPDVIGPEMPPEWRAAAAAHGVGDEQIYPFLYLPWVAAVMAPVAANIAPQVAMNGLLLINLVLLILCAVLAWRILPSRWSLARWMAVSILLLAVGAPALLALLLGQLQIIVFTACLLCIDRLQSGRSVQGALWLAFAAVLKITPAAFAIIFIWNRDWKGLAVFTVATLGFAGFTIFVLGWPLHAQYFALMDKLNASVVLSNIGVSAEGLLLQVVDLIRGVPHFFTETEAAFPKPVWQDLLIKSLFVLGLLAIWHSSRKAPRRERLGHQFFALAILVPIMAPLGWIHYFLLSGFMMPLLLEREDRLERAMFLAYLVFFNLITLYLMLLPSRAVMMQFFVYVPYLAVLFLVVTFRARLLLASLPAARPTPAEGDDAR